MQRQKLRSNPKKKFGHRNGRSSCAHSIGKFFLCYIVLFSFETSATGSPGNYLYHLLSSWWFQPNWKTLVKLDDFPNLGWKKKLIETTTLLRLLCLMVFVWVSRHVIRFGKNASHLRTGGVNRHSIAAAAGRPTFHDLSGNIQEPSGLPTRPRERIHIPWICRKLIDSNILNWWFQPVKLDHFSR